MGVCHHIYKKKARVHLEALSKFTVHLKDREMSSNGALKLEVPKVEQFYHLS